MKKAKHTITEEKTEHHAEIFANRLKRQYKHLARRFRRNNIDVFRLYDWDIPEVRAVVDWYQGHLVVAEYVRLQTSAAWLPRMAQAAGEVLQVPHEKIFLKQRQTKSSTGKRYVNAKGKGERFVVAERDLKFWVNLDHHLDTGLYSDHRETRMLIREMVKGHDFLNLFAYTGAFSCAAALGGAKSILTVDRSATYIEWAKENFKLNNLKDPNYRFVCADVEKHLDVLKTQGEKFTFAFVDPPSFYRDQSQRKVFDINVHHPSLLRKVFAVMDKDATVIFSTNHQRFEPRFDKLKVKAITELTPKTIPEDYRNKMIHRCWRMELA